VHQAPVTGSSGMSARKLGVQQRPPPPPRAQQAGPPVPPPAAQLRLHATGSLQTLRQTGAGRRGAGSGAPGPQGPAHALSHAPALPLPTPRAQAAAPQNLQTPAQAAAK
jgi:hypothetical protein